MCAAVPLICRGSLVPYSQKSCDHMMAQSRSLTLPRIIFIEQRRQIRDLQLFDFHGLPRGMGKGSFEKTVIRGIALPIVSLLDQGGAQSLRGNKGRKQLSAHSGDASQGVFRPRLTLETFQHVENVSGSWELPKRSWFAGRAVRVRRSDI